ncbi:MAG: 3-phosphoshikimate 1-carboxyvinyltransferase [Chloroflexaceae bacterium]|nr:3-phosphoshikimate 1-carboxyvinyltransferase [Chloroflexaceae bacterium]NJO05828.1 3-phosphoshikimate 1-carboxyvinyltransferase [Chloroflexaceae bacterium]
MSRITLQAPRHLRGKLLVPGDKSVSHRAVMFNAIARGRARITNFLTGADCLSTIACMQALGVEIERQNDTVIVNGVGLRGLREPTDVLDCGNSGTTLRLLTGLLAGQPFFSVLTGDASLRARPQRRITEPLRSLGASIDGRANGDRAPLAVRGAPMHGGRYTLSIASAQVKSALLLAALTSDAPLRLDGQIDSRDHTERMLSAMGIDIGIGLDHITLFPPLQDAESKLIPHSLTLRVPGDPSSAAFWWVAAAIHPDAEITTTGVCLNPTRTGALDVLRAMGANLTISNETIEGSEPIGDVTVHSSELVGTRIEGDLIPRLIDEIPVLAVAAACATGETIVRDAQELRVKESDRIATVVTGLQALGVEAEDQPDGFIVSGRGGEPLRGAVLNSHGDHRLAMAWAVAALAANPETTIIGAEAVQVSYPGFWETLAMLGHDV